MGYLIEDILDDAKASEFFPASRTTLEDPDLIRFANQEMTTKIVPIILRVRQDFFVKSIYQRLTLGKSRYPVSSRAVGNALKGIYYVPDIREPEGKFPMTKASDREVTTGIRSRTAPYSFRFEGDEIVLSPSPGAIGQHERLEIEIFQRPNALVETTSCGKITAVSSSGGTTTITVDTNLTGSLSPGKKIDLLSAESPFMLWAQDVAIQAIAGTSIQVLTEDVENEVGEVEIAVGDYLCPAGHANIPMIPVEFHPILSELVCYRAMKALGAQAKIQELKSNLRDMIESATMLIANRVEEEVDVLYDPNGILNALGGGGRDLGLGVRSR